MRLQCGLRVELVGVSKRPQWPESGAGEHVCGLRVELVGVSKRLRWPESGAGGHVCGLRVERPESGAGCQPYMDYGLTQDMGYLPYICS